MVSAKSIKQKYLRGVSLNNKDHLDGVSKKEGDLKNYNSNLIENFINSLNKMGREMRGVFPEKLQQKIEEIWTLYYQEQRQKADFVNVDFQMNDGRRKINSVFQEKLRLKAENFNFDLQKSIYQSIFKTIQ